MGSCLNWILDVQPIGKNIIYGKQWNILIKIVETFIEYSKLKCFKSSEEDKIKYCAKK